MLWQNFTYFCTKLYEIIRRKSEPEEGKKVIKRTEKEKADLMKEVMGK